MITAMGRRMAVIFGLVMFSCAPRIAAEDQGKEELVWSDEFEGNALDGSKWEVIVNGRGGGNKELQYYLKENVRVADGMLRIGARKEQHGGPDGQRDYTSGKIRSKGKGDWKYGRIEVRAKLPKGKGIWPAVWMMPTDNRYGNWPNSGEIDIVEVVGHEPDRVHGTLHYGDRQKRQMEKGSSFKLAKGTFADDFHVFGLEWEKGKISWSVDGKVH
ncbi:MAG TPA: glycoside hydrolase family 16 protein, partial [Tepidisphaeraceae bacterium]|nr:glycoside hydrolase family 16 protein [Tepidisphaeraceae bacterium]